MHWKNGNVVSFIFQLKDKVFNEETQGSTQSRWKEWERWKKHEKLLVPRPQIMRYRGKGRGLREQERERERAR